MSEDQEAMRRELRSGESLLLEIPRFSQDANRMLFRGALPAFGLLAVAAVIVSLGALSTKGAIAALLAVLLAVYLLVLLMRRSRTAYGLTSKRALVFVNGKLSRSFDWNECEKPSSGPVEKSRERTSNSDPIQKEVAGFVRIALAQRKPPSWKKWITGLDDSAFTILPPNESISTKGILKVAQDAWEAAQ